MSGRRPRPAPWRRAVARLATPWLFALALAVAAGVHVVHSVAGDLASAQPLAVGRAALAAQLVADDAVLASFGKRAGRLAAAVPGAAAHVHRDGATVYVHAEVDGSDGRWFAADVLPGAPPAAFTRPLTVGSPDGAPCDAHVDRELAATTSPRIAAGMADAAALGLVAAQSSIALQHQRGGTDDEDFVFVAGDHDLGRAAGVLVVPGHLWIEPGDEPCRLRATADLVLLVRGNVYLGRPVRVVGGGRVVLAAVADPGDLVFADLDDDGRCGARDRVFGAGGPAAPIEGRGSVVTIGRGVGPLVCDAALWAAGCLQLKRSLHVDGPVALVRGVQPLAPDAVLVVRDRWRCHGERDALAGFPTTGGPRPGFLRPCAAPHAATLAKVPLYLSGPLR